MPHELTGRRGCQGAIESNGVFVAWLRNGKSSYGNDDGRRKAGVQGMLPLLQTCRFVYAEAVVVLYKIPMFMVSNIEALRGWNESVLATRFAAVRTLDLRISIKLRRIGHGRGSLQDDDRWQGLWHVLRGMEG